MPELGKLQVTEVVVVLGGSLVDGPGFKLVSNGHGGFTVVPIPGWGPDVMRDVGPALRALAAGAQINSAEGISIVNVASKIVRDKIQQQIGPAAVGHLDMTFYSVPG